MTPEVDKPFVKNPRLVEQNARMALSIAHGGSVIQSGEMVLRDSARHLIQSDLVGKFYLGERVSEGSAWLESSDLSAVG